jgi:hypothetical protein
VNERAITAS